MMSNTEVLVAKRISCQGTLISPPERKEQQYKKGLLTAGSIVQELCESRGGRPGLSVLTSLLVSVDVKIY